MAQTEKMVITPLQVLLAEDFDQDGFDDLEYDDYPYEGVLELTRDF